MTGDAGMPSPPVAGLATIDLMDDAVGVIEIADRLGYPARTVHMWVFREVLPPVDFPSINGSPAWRWVKILRWAGSTGRLDRRPDLEAVLADLLAAERKAERAAARGRAKTNGKAKKAPVKRKATA